MNAKQLVELANRMHSQRSTLMSLWQDTAENFYVERADFTVSRTMGDHVADGLTTSYPLMVRRDLGNQLGMMQRPTAKQWFDMTVEDEEDLDHESRAWLEYATKVQFRAMYDPVTQFTRAMKEADHDFAAFGQYAGELRLNRNRDALLYRCWHLRDVAWMENDEGKIAAVFRRWKPTVRDLRRLFPGKNHPQTVQDVDKDPYQLVDCWHIVVEADMYDDKTRQPYFSLYYDQTHEHLVEVIGVPDLIYWIPRWQTVSGSQYAYSPATVVGLPDARLLQAMTLTLLEAGQKAVTPPMVAVGEAIRGDIALYAGGITQVDIDYDERLGEALRPITQDKNGIPLGLDMQRDARAMLMKAFYLDQLALPQRGPEMTAYEVGQRVQEWIRNAMPIFEPMEMENNGQVCDRTFQLLLRNGAFGSPLDIPRKLRGRDVRFRFKSPLHDAIEMQKGQKFLESKALLAEAAALDRNVLPILDAGKAMRDILTGIETPQKWLRSEADVETILRQIQADQTRQVQLAEMEQGAEVAVKVAQARKDLAGSGASAPV